MVTSRCVFARSAEYNADWNGIDSSDDPALATLRLLHSARQMVDTSRWWTLRWPNSAISLLGTACGLRTEGTFKLLRRLRKVTVHHVRELWAVVMDRRHAADNVAKRAALKEELLKLYRVLANMRNRRRGKLMPGWITLQQKPIHTIKSRPSFESRTMIVPHQSPSACQTELAGSSSSSTVAGDQRNLLVSVAIRSSSWPLRWCLSAPSHCTRTLQWWRNANHVGRPSRRHLIVF